MRTVGDRDGLQKNRRADERRGRSKRKTESAAQKDHIRVKKMVFN